MGPKFIFLESAWFTQLVPFSKCKNRSKKKVMPISYPGIQPINALWNENKIFFLIYLFILSVQTVKSRSRSWSSIKWNGNTKFRLKFIFDSKLSWLWKGSAAWNSTFSFSDVVVSGGIGWWTLVVCDGCWTVSRVKYVDFHLFIVAWSLGLFCDHLSLCTFLLFHQPFCFFVQ